MGELASAIGHADRHEPLKAYISGLCLPGERKSIEPMAARIDPYHVQARHQSMHHFIAKAPWEDIPLLRIARNRVIDQMDRHGGITAWIIDDTGILKKGKCSVGVARQYCGSVGKTDNCQVAVSLSITNETISIPVAYRLYLPEDWADSPKRRSDAGVPQEMGFLKKWQIALGQIAWLFNEGIPPAPVIADAGYGNITDFRDQLSDWNIPYTLGIVKTTSLWPPGVRPLKPKKHSGRGRPPTRLRRDKNHRPLTAETIAKQLPKRKWRTISWREGTKGIMRSRFAFIRVIAGHVGRTKHELRKEEWLIVEWPENEKGPTKYWLSSMPGNSSFEHLIKVTKMRWRIERDYEELKSEFGLDHFEGRGWRGFHHHATLCIAAYAFMASERAKFSPPESISFLRAAPVPKGFKPRGSPCTA
jgi:SRSO17 transposase